MKEMSRENDGEFGPMDSLGPKVDIREFVALLRDGMNEETAMEMVLQEVRGRRERWERAEAGRR